MCAVRNPSAPARGHIGNLSDRLSGLGHDPYSPLPKLRLEHLPLVCDNAQLPLQSRTPRYEERIISYFPEFEAEITDPGSRAMLVRHVASMASGHAAETVERAFGGDPEELVRGFLRIPPDHAPGTVFAYNQPATYTLAAIVQRVTGQSLTEYLRTAPLRSAGHRRDGLAAGAGRA